MTDHQLEGYEGALASAEWDAVQVIGRGMTMDGRRVYAVPARTVANLWHLILVAHGALVCNCAAGRHGRYRRQRKVVRARLEREASATVARALEASGVARSAGWQGWSGGGRNADVTRRRWRAATRRSRSGSEREVPPC